MAHVFISRTWGPKTEKTLWVWGYLGLHSEFQDIQSYLEILSKIFITSLKISYFESIQSSQYYPLPNSKPSSPFPLNFVISSFYLLPSIPMCVSLGVGQTTRYHIIKRKPTLPLQQPPNAKTSPASAGISCLPSAVCTGILSDWSLPRFYASCHNFFGFICAPAILSF